MKVPRENPIGKQPQIIDRSPHNQSSSQILVLEKIPPISQSTATIPKLIGIPKNGAPCKNSFESLNSSIDLNRENFPFLGCACTPAFAKSNSVSSFQN